ncbi:MAG: CsgG/HfaB family protein [Myxococcota bacterium]
MFAPAILTNPVSRALAGVLALLVLSGCPAAKYYKEGKYFDEDGQEYLAAERYLSALGENEKHKKAREALVAVAKAAYEEKLGLAQRAEEGQNFPKALTEYREIDVLLDDLREYDALTFDVIHVEAKIEEMENSSAEQQYQKAEKQLAERAFENAIHFYKAAQEFKRGYKDTKEKIALAYYAWAEDDLKGNRYRVAAEHFAAATDAAGKGYKDASTRAGVLYASLGKYFLGADRCRQSVKDLRRAGEFLGADKVQADLAAAEECAVTPVAILPFENPTGTNLAGMALGDTLADQIGGKVRAGASEFVRLMERASLDAVLAEQGISASGLASGATSKLRGVRYLVMGKLTQVKLDKPGLASTPKATAATQPYDCEKTTSDGKTVKTVCETPVTVKYVERSGRIAVRVAGTARIVDVKTGEQLVTLPLEAAFEDAVHYADSFTLNGNQVTPVRKGHRGDVRVEDDLLDLAKAKRDLKSEDQLAAAVLDKLALESAQAVLAAVDVEKEAVDPAKLVMVEVK